jgi:5-methylcytosine-specific restriction endonuclease McrA
MNLRKKVITGHPWCARCGISKKEAKLEVHHVVPPHGNEELFYNEDNCTVVCGSCHRKITAEEIRRRNNGQH